MGSIYLLTFANGKKYVGKTQKSPTRRFNEHRRNTERGLDFAVCRAWRKYGAPQLRVLCCCVDSLLSELEIFYINHQNTMTPNGYNLTQGGSGGTMSDEVMEKSRRTRSTSEFKDRMSAITSSPEYKARMSTVMSVAKNTQEGLTNASMAAKKCWQNPAYVEKQRLSLKSEKRKVIFSDPTYRSKLSKVFKELRADPEYRLAQSIRLKEVNGTPEARSAIAARAKSRWADPDFKAKRLEAMNSPEYKQKRKAMWEARSKK